MLNAVQAATTMSTPTATAQDAQAANKSSGTHAVVTVGKSTNIRKEDHSVSRKGRAQLLGVDSAFRGCTVWFTGLSGAGKTTLSFALEAELVKRGVPAYGLDGDNIRTGLCKNLGFSPADRAENIRRVGEVSKLFADGGIVSLCSFISPTIACRKVVRDMHDGADLPFYEIHVATPLSVCESRDVKGLYKKARAGIIKGFTGIDSAYEAPVQADVVVGANGEPIEASVKALAEFLESKGVLPAAGEEPASKRRKADE